MKKRISSIAVLAVVALAVACRGTSAHFPERHRDVASACPSTPRAPGYNNPNLDAGKGYSGQCERDTDCVAGRNGRCSFPGHAQSMCSYDQCMADADCGAGKVCDCRDGHTCLPANCHTDADCGGLGCSPTNATSCGNMGGTVGYYCHTKKDDCIDDGDCKKKGTESGMCVYEPAASRWTCNYDRCVG